MHLITLILLLTQLSFSAIVYINSPDDILVLNFTCTPSSPSSLEAARLNCKAAADCAYLAVQDNGDYIGKQQFTFLSQQNPFWTPYTCAEAGAFNLMNGFSINQIYPQLDVYAIIRANILPKPGCVIGTAPLYDTGTGQLLCPPQVDASASSFAGSNKWTWIAIAVVAACVAWVLYYVTYVQDGWFNAKLVAPVGEYAVDSKQLSVRTFLLGDTKEE